MIHAKNKYFKNCTLTASSHSPHRKYWNNTITVTIVPFNGVFNYNSEINNWHCLCYLWLCVLCSKIPLNISLNNLLQCCRETFTMLMLHMTCKTGRDRLDRDVFINHQIWSLGQAKYSDLLTLCPTSGPSLATRPTITQIHRHKHSIQTQTHTIHHHTSHANIFVVLCTCQSLYFHKLSPSSCSLALLLPGQRWCYK